MNLSDSLSYSMRQVLGTSAAVGDDHIAALPRDILKVVMSILPIHDVWSLESTSLKNIKRIKEANLERTQKNLENILSDLVEKVTVGSLKWIRLPREYDALNKKVKIAPNISTEKCRALRDVICSIFNEINWGTFLELMDSHIFYEDKHLPIQVIKKNFERGEISIRSRIDLSSHKTTILIFKMLKENLLKSTYLELITYNTFLNNKSFILLKEAIEKSRTLKTLSLKPNNWEYRDLQTIVEVIKNNQSIKTVYIAETEMDQYGEWYMAELIKYLPKKQLEHYDKLFEIVNSELGPLGTCHRQTDLFWWNRNEFKPQCKNG